MVKITVPVTRREQGADPLDQHPEDDGNDASHDLRAQYGGQAEFAANGLERGDVGEADAHDDGQAGADAVEDGKELEQGGQGGQDQRDLDHQGLVRAAQTAGVRNQDGRGNDADYGGDHVLESQREKLSGLRDAAPLENGILAGGVGVTHSNRLTKIF